MFYIFWNSLKERKEEQTYLFEETDNHYDNYDINDLETSDNNYLSFKMYYYIINERINRETKEASACFTKSYIS